MEIVMVEPKDTLKYNEIKNLETGSSITVTNFNGNLIVPIAPEDYARSGINTVELFSDNPNHKQGIFNKIVNKINPENWLVNTESYDMAFAVLDEKTKKVIGILGGEVSYDRGVPVFTAYKVEDATGKVIDLSEKFSIRKREQNNFDTDTVNETWIIRTEEASKKFIDAANEGARKSLEVTENHCLNNEITQKTLNEAIAAIKNPPVGSSIPNVVVKNETGIATRIG